MKQNEDPHMFVRVQLAEGSVLKAVCWGYSLWKENYYKFGVVPGVCIDAKALANNYDIPFVSISGRDHDGKNKIFFMGFIPNERVESMCLFLNGFRDFVKAPPSMVCCDQDAAIMHAITV